MGARLRDLSYALALAVIVAVVVAVFTSLVVAAAVGLAVALVLFVLSLALDRWEGRALAPGDRVIADMGLEGDEYGEVVGAGHAPSGPTVRVLLDRGHEVVLSEEVVKRPRMLARRR